MPPGSRREFLQVAGATGLTFVSASGEAAAFSLGDAPALRPGVLPSADELGRQTIRMNDLGDRFTGAEAHRAHVEYLVSGLQAAGLNVQRETGVFTRWLATRWAAKLTPLTGAPVDLSATSYYPYSGVTGPEGVTGELVQRPNTATADRQIAATGDLKGKVVFIEVAGLVSPLGDGSKPLWGFDPKSARYPTHISAVWGSITPGLLGDLKAAGAVGVILGWTNISDDQASGQYSPYGRPIQDLPCVWVGRESAAALRGAAGTGARASVILQAQVTPNVSVDTVWAVLPGQTSEEVLIVESHSDGMNFLEENGSLALLAMARYFAKLPRAERKRDIVFVLPSHFARADLVGIPGWIQRHPDLLKKAAAWVTVEHLGCREWFDDAAGAYAPSGRDETSFAITDFKGVADAALGGARGGDRLAVIHGPRVPGEGGAFYRTGVPGLGFFPAPNYLLSFAKNGHIDKFSPTLMQAQVENLTRAILKLDGMTAAQIRAG
ncbi:hypothetical protein [Phenylobacterium sp.]|uniref:hypothetical protein n=1 Tax=Phenylobacterium sp. TaxID=1871053 RepID=UPI0035615FBD